MTFSQEDAGLSATQFSSEPPVGLVADSPRDAKSLLAAILASLDDAKAEEIVEIDIAGKTPIADYMVVCSGRSQRHVGAIADHLVEDLKDNGFGTAAIASRDRTLEMLVSQHTQTTNKTQAGHAASYLGCGLNPAWNTFLFLGLGRGQGSLVGLEGLFAEEAKKLLVPPFRTYRFSSSSSGGES